MAHVVIMPRQGNSVESCIIIDWKVKEGDTVTVDTPVVEVETDKATFEVPAGADGTVLKILNESGDDVPVLQPIMVVGNPGEDWQALVGETVPVAANTVGADASVEKNIAVANVSISPPELTQVRAQSVERSAGEHLSISPRARLLSIEKAVDFRNLVGTGPEGRIIEQDIQAVLTNRAPLTVAAKDALRSQIAAGLASGAIHGEGSGFGGRVTTADASAFAKNAGAGVETLISSAAAVAVFGTEISDEYTDTTIKGIRKLIADRMMSSLATTAQFTLNASANAVQMQRLRARFKESKDELGLSKVTVNDLVLFLVSRVLPLHGSLNAQKLDGAVRQYKHVHLGVAVDTSRGLMVPVIRFANRLSLAQISAQAKELASACQDGSINPNLLKGSTFTVSNLGNTGIESFTPVINTPEVAILGVCGIQPKPVDNGQGGYDMLPHLAFSLTIDHAVVDGAPAARFLKVFCDALKDIDLWLSV